MLKQCTIVATALYLISLMTFLSTSWTSEINSQNYKQVTENITQALIEMTQESLLRTFGIDMKRKPSRSFTPHDYMLEVYSLLSGDSDVARTTRINTVRGIIDTDSNNERLFRLPHQTFRFNIAGIPKAEDLIGCEFRLQWSPVKVASRLRRYRSLRYKMFYKMILLGILPKDNIKGQNSTSSQRLEVTPLATRVFDLANMQAKWFSFEELAKFSQKARDRGVNIMKLVVYFTEMSSGRIVSPDDIGFDKNGRIDKEKGLLVLFSDDKTKKRDEEQSTKGGRAKRGARRGRRKDRKGRSRKRNKALCRRRRMLVSFADFGWTNWIIAPKDYDAYYCRGNCNFPIPGHLNPTSHAVIQSTISSMNPQFMKPACCVPDKLKSIAMLHLDSNDRVVYQKKEDMVVVSCACR